MIPVGKLVLNRNPKNYHAEVEQIAFTPANMVPGIEASPDKMLQGRLFSYADTHRHRLGPNYAQIPVNSPISKPQGYTRDGPMCVINHGSGPNYFPNSFNGPHEDSVGATSVYQVSGDVKREDTAGDDNFSQVTNFWTNVLNAEERKRLAANIGGHLKNAPGFIRERAIANFSQVNGEFGEMIRNNL